MVEKFIGRKWDKTAKWLDSHIHLFALADANDIPARDVVQAYKDAGINAAMGVMCAHLYVMENGPDAGVAMAVKIYQDICTEIIRYSRSRGAMRRKAEALMEEMKHIINQMVWCYYLTPPEKWPLKFGLKTKSDRGGLANVMMAIACKQMLDQGAAKDLLVSAVSEFLAKKDEKQKSSTASSKP